jgi:hypothetical protein
MAAEAAMRRRFFRVLAGAALFLTGYGMQQGNIEPFTGAADPRFLGLLLEGLGLVILLIPLLGRNRRLLDVKPPRIRRELLYKPEDPDAEPAPAPESGAKPEKPTNSATDKPD